jgi:hypothetical protein
VRRSQQQAVMAVGGGGGGGGGGAGGTPRGAVMVGPSEVLPAGWVAKLSMQYAGRSFYTKVATGETRWDRPPPEPEPEPEPGDNDDDMI